MLRAIGPMELFLLAIIVVGVIVVSKSGRTVRMAALGGLVGAVLGILVRPSVPLIGQLPVGIVITGGATLNGVDVLLKSTAEQSFNYMMIGALFGGLVFGVWGSSTSRKSSVPTEAPSLATPATPVPSLPPVTASSPGNPFCTKCGTALTSDVVFCGSCGTRRG